MHALHGARGRRQDNLFHHAAAIFCSMLRAPPVLIILWHWYLQHCCSHIFSLLPHTAAIVFCFCTLSQRHIHRGTISTTAGATFGQRRSYYRPAWNHLYLTWGQPHASPHRDLSYQNPILQRWKGYCCKCREDDWHALRWRRYSQ